MRLAVVDAHGEVIHTWDDAIVAQEAIIREAGKMGRFRFMRRRYEAGMRKALNEFLLQIARM